MDMTIPKATPDTPGWSGDKNNPGLGEITNLCIDAVGEAGKAASEALKAAGAVLPAFTPEDKGKTLGLSQDGTLAWVTAAGETPGKISWIAGKGLPGHVTLSSDNGLQQRSAYPEFWALAEKYFDVRPEAEWQAELAKSKADGTSGAVAFFSAGDGSTTFRFPLHRNVYVRSEDVPAGVLSGMYQTDTMRPITGSWGGDRTSVSATNLVSGACSQIRPYTSGNGATGGDSGGYGISIDSSKLGVNYSGTQTQPKTIVLTPVMKVVDVAINPSLLLTDEFVRGLDGKLDTSRYEVDRVADAKATVLAWAVIEGSTTPPKIINGSRIASVIRITKGVFELNFITPLASKDYVVSGTIGMASQLYSASGTSLQAYNTAVTGFTIATTHPTMGHVDFERININVIGGV